MQDGYVPVEIHTCVDADHESATIRVRGEIDVATAPLLREAIMAQIPCHRRTIADLADVTFMDAAGVAVLMRADETARRCGVQLTISRPTGLVARVLHLTQADLVLDIRPESRRQR